MRSLVITLLVSAVAISSCSSDEPENQNRRQLPVPTVEAVVAQFGSLPLEERLSGSVRAYNQTEIYSELSAPVMEILVNNGDRVEKGQPLIRLRDFETRERVRQAQASLQIAEAQVRQSEARLNQLRTQLERIKQLASRDMQSQAELDQLQSEVMAAEATNQLNQAQRAQAHSVLLERENQLELTVVRAPITGFVGHRNADVGQLVTPSTRLFTIGDLERMRIQVTLTENMLNRISTGMRVHLSSPAFPDSVITASVTRISPFLNPVTHTADTEIEITNRGGLLKPGMFVNVDIFYGDSEQATLIPNSALYRHPREGFEGIYVAPSLGQELQFEYVEGQEIPQMVGPTPVEFRRVQVVAKGRMVSAVRGIEPQTYVVTLGQNLLVDGSSNARIRRVDWSHIMDLQQMQSRDLLRIIRDRSESRLSRNTGTPATDPS